MMQWSQTESLLVESRGQKRNNRQLVIIITSKMALCQGKSHETQKGHNDSPASQ